jgi:copper(I)-binding protein
MQLKSARGATLVAAESPAAGAVEIHAMRMEGNVMRMRAIGSLELPAGQTVELKPGGYHAMLLDLKAPLKKGDVVPLRLKVRGKDGEVAEIDVAAEVRELTANGAGHAKH